VTQQVENFEHYKRQNAERQHVKDKTTVVNNIRTVRILNSETFRIIIEKVALCSNNNTEPRRFHARVARMTPDLYKGPDTPGAIRQRDAIFRFSLTDNFHPSLNFPNI
jgi:hypothetical protein